MERKKWNEWVMRERGRDRRRKRRTKHLHWVPCHVSSIDSKMWSQSFSTTLPHLSHLPFLPIFFPKIHKASFTSFYHNHVDWNSKKHRWRIIEIRRRWSFPCSTGSLEPVRIPETKRLEYLRSVLKKPKAACFTIPVQLQPRTGFPTVPRSVW